MAFSEGAIARLHEAFMDASDTVQVHAGAVIAALLGGLEAGAASDLAERSFYGVNLSSLRRNHLASSTPQHELFRTLARPVRLGEVDAFISHRHARGAAAFVGGWWALGARPPRGAP